MKAKRQIPIDSRFPRFHVFMRVNVIRNLLCEHFPHFQAFHVINDTEDTHLTLQLLLSCRKYLISDKLNVSQRRVRFDLFECKISKISCLYISCDSSGTEGRTRGSKNEDATAKVDKFIFLMAPF